MGLWGFNDPIVEAVAFHHEPSKCGSCEFSPVTALHAAQFIIDSNKDNFNVEYEIPAAFDQKYLADTGVAERLLAWQKLIPAVKDSRHRRVPS